MAAFRKRNGRWRAEVCIKGVRTDVSAASLDALFRKARTRAQIEDLHFHDTRREALTRLSNIFDVMELARISGHRDLRILQKVYQAYRFYLLE